MAVRWPSAMARVNDPRPKTNPFTLFLGVDSNRQPIQTYTGTGSRQDGSGQHRPSRYHNYLPELRAKRVETLKENNFKDKLMERLEIQRQAEEVALNKLVIQKAQRIGPTPRIPPLPPALVSEPPQHRVPLTAHAHNHNPVHKKPPQPKVNLTIQSLFRASPEAFSDSGSRVVQLDLAKVHPKPKLTVTKLQPSATSSTTDSEVSEFLKKKTRKR